MKKEQGNVPEKKGTKKAVYVNGVYCESVAAAAKKASEILGEKVLSWHIQGAVNGVLAILGIDISETPPKKREPSTPKKCLAPLLRYPFGEKPMDRGILHWK